MSTPESAHVLNAASITYTDDEATLCYEQGFSLTLSRGELARLLAVKRRPRTSTQAVQHERIPLPRLLSDFNATQRIAYAEVHGDAEALEVFGDGPWLKKYRR